MASNDTFFVTPRLTLTRNRIFEVDARRTLPSGMVVGNDKYKIAGFFDPAGPDMAGVRAACAAALKEAGAPPKTHAAAIQRAFPSAASLRERALARAEQAGLDEQAAARKAGYAAPASIPGDWLRFTASTGFGPVPVVEGAGTAVEDQRKVFCGCSVVVDAKAKAFLDPKEGAWTITSYLNQVYLIGPGDRLPDPDAGGAQRDAKQVFAQYVKGGTSSADPFSSEEIDDEIPF